MYSKAEQMNRLRRRTVFIMLAVIGLLCAIPAAAIDAYVTVVYRKVDIAFINRSDSELDGVLGEVNTDRNYYLIENYTMKKIRRLVIEEEYEFAVKADLVVIDNNLDNMEAVELYATISAALEKQKEQERILFEQKQLEIARFEAEKNRQKVVLEKSYSVAQTPEGDTVYVKSKEEKFSAIWWKIAFGMFDGAYILDAGHGYNSFRYGVSVDFNYEYNLDKVLLGLDITGQGIFLPFTGDDGTILCDFEFIPKMGLPKLNKYLQFRAGVAGIISIDSGDESQLQGNVFSPTVGIGLSRINLGRAAFSASADYLFGHFAYSGLNFAMNSAMNLALPIAEMEKFKVAFNIGAKDTLFVRSSGVENRAGLVLAIGVENVIK